MTFYSSAPGQGLRFGDVIRGIVAVAPEFKLPSDDDPPNWLIRVTMAKFFAVLSPCCSIEKGKLLVAPLLQIRPSFLVNPYLSEDLTRLNGTVPAEKTLPPDAWSQLPELERLERLAQGAGYIFQDCFVYAPNDLLDEYVLHRRGGSVTQRHYLVDFGSAFRIECDSVIRNRPAPMGTKILELAIDSRWLLRQKIAAYYARIPEEDMQGIAG